MTRQNITPNPSLKLFEGYLDFSGGLNSETGNEMLKDNEFPILQNVDLMSRGSAKRRTGRTKLASVAGTAQGLFYYYREGEPIPDLVFAVSGQIYVLEQATGNPVTIPLMDVSQSPAVQLTFQNSLPIQAVQYGTSMYLATGTRYSQLTYDTSAAWATGKAYAVGDLVKSNHNVYKCTTAGTSGATAPTGTGTGISDGACVWAYQWFEWNAQTVTPYAPTVMEAIYIGTNGLAANPDQYVQDGTSATLQVAGIQPSMRTGAVNENLTLTAYIDKPNTITSVTYKWEWKYSQDTTWTLGRDFTADAAGKSWTFEPDTATQYDFRVTAKDNTAGVQNPATAQYSLTGYVVNQTEDKSTNTSRPVDGIQSCRKILLHWDRILLSGDDLHPYQMYISDLNAPTYFPVSNTISFDTGKQEPITALVRFRDYLVVFTKTSIQTLTGKTTDNYARNLIHSELGCIADLSACVTGNNITFLSAEGIQMLKPNPYMLEVMNVNRVDYSIKSEIQSAANSNACALVYDSQYWLCFPSTKTIYRLYYEAGGVWAKDYSTKLNLLSMTHYGGDVYDMSLDGNIYKHDNTLHSDDGEAYDMDVEAKFYDLGATFNWKKIKRLFMLARHFTQDVNLKVTVQADSALVLNPQMGEVGTVTNPDGTVSVTWSLVTTPNMHFYTGTVLGSWILGQTPLGDVQISVQEALVRGRCRRVKVRFTHSEDTPCEVFGFGIEFKEKKPY